MDDVHISSAGDLHDSLSSQVYNVTYVTQTGNPDGTVTANYTAGYLGTFILGAAAGAILPMGVAIGGRHIVMVAITILTRGHTVAHITGVTAIIIQRLTMILLRELTDGNRLLMGRTDQRRVVPVTILTPALMREVPGFRLRMGVEAQHRRITRTRAPMLRRDRVRATQWGSSYVSRGNKSATMGHYSTANGTVAGISGSQGGKAVGANTAGGNTAAGKTASGNMYAGHDGNVYKNTGNGWQRYDNGSWNSVSKPQPNWQGAESSQQRTASESYQQRSSAAGSDDRSGGGGGSDRSGGGGLDRSGGGGGSGDLDREAQNRSRGDFSSERFQGFQGGGFDRSGGGGGFGGDRFGGGGFSGGGDRFGGGGLGSVAGFGGGGGGGFRGRR